MRTRIFSYVNGIAIAGLAFFTLSCSGSTSNSAADTMDSTSTAPQIAESTRIDIEVNDSASAEEKAKPMNFKFDSAQAAIEHMKNSGHWSEYSAGILPRMAEENLEYCTKLLNSRYPHFIVVDKSKMKVFLYSRFGVKEKEYPMACSRNYGQKRGQWDSRTPEGFFSAEGIYDSTNWKFTNAAGYTSPARGVYGTRFIRIKAPQTSSCGIHGTSSPGSIGHRASHGCVRISNSNILDLVKYAEAGMPIIVNPGPLDLRANADAGIHVPTITTDGEPVKMAEPSQNKTQTTKKAEPAKATNKANADSSKNSDGSAKAVEPAEETAPAEATPATEPASPEKTAPATPAAPETPSTPATPEKAPEQPA